jgi:hypothetical protein
MTIAYVNPLTGQTINPSQVGYESLTIGADTFLEWPINGNYSPNVVASIIQVTATTTGLSLIMPSALQVSTGESVLIQNIGSNPFTVTNNSGGTIISIASGIAQYIFLTSNSTNAGTWSTVTFGAGTSSANASTLAGYGLQAINTTLNQAYVATNVYSNLLVNATYRAQLLIWQGGVGTFTFPTSASIGNNWFCMVRNGGSGTLTLTPSGSDTIDGNSSEQLQPTESLVIVSNGSSGYNTFGYGRSNNFVYTQLAKTVTTGTYTLSAVEYANVVQEYIGALTGNVTIVLPSTVQIYYLNNLTSGSYTLTFKTSAVGGATVVVPQGQTISVICDGTNVYNANTVISGSIASLTINSGSASTPSINFTGDTNTGIYHPTSGQVAISISGVNAATFTSSGLTVVAGIGGGNF